MTYYNYVKNYICEVYIMEVSLGRADYFRYSQDGRAADYMYIRYSHDGPWNNALAKRKFELVSL